MAKVHPVLVQNRIQSGSLVLSHPFGSALPLCPRVPRPLAFFQTFVARIAKPLGLPGPHLDLRGLTVIRLLIETSYPTAF